MIDLEARIAVLIDADNASLNYVEQVIKISQYHGDIKICRAYGDWMQPPLHTKVEMIDGFNIECRQVERIGKNATDHWLLVEAGEILVDDPTRPDGDRMDSIVLVSGDGDFASACRLFQQRGVKVIVIGGKNTTSDSLQQNCNKFYSLEDL